MRTLTGIRTIFFVSLLCPISNATEKTKFRWEEIHDVYAFGDSYTFVQGSLGLPNFSFIGDAFHPSFTPQQLFSDVIIPKNTSSDGANWIEFLTGCFTGSPAACSPRHLYDFAFAGSDISGDLLPLHHNFTVPLVDQVNQWEQYAADILPNSPDSTLVAWWIGINDTGDTLKNATITNFTEFWTQEMDAYFEAVEVVYRKGLRNFLFLNVPPEERSPAQVNDVQFGPVLKRNIDLFNYVLQSFISAFSYTHEEANVITFDAHEWFNYVLDNGEKFGFTNTTGFCTCPTPQASSFFWFNSGHPTEHVHRLLAAAIQGELSRIN